jgi:hypothetical protein
VEAAARAAYEAFCKAMTEWLPVEAILSGTTEWDRLPQSLRDGWMAAAKAAIAEKGST